MQKKRKKHADPSSPFKCTFKAPFTRYSATQSSRRLTARTLTELYPPSPPLLLLPSNDLLVRKLLEIEENRDDVLQSVRNLRWFPSQSCARIIADAAQALWQICKTSWGGNKRIRRLQRHRNSNTSTRQRCQRDDGGNFQEFTWLEMVERCGFFGRPRSVSCPVCSMSRSIPKLVIVLTSANNVTQTSTAILFGRQTRVISRA